MQHIISAVVPRADRRMRIAARDHAKLRKWWRTDESLVGKNFVSRGMIDRQQPHLIQIHCFFHGLHETETEQPIASLHAACGYLQIFIWIGNIPVSGTDPVADHAGPDHVRDEFILAAIPRKQNRARTSSPVEFENALYFLRGQVDFVLRYAHRPQQSNDFGAALRAE